MYAQVVNGINNIKETGDIVTTLLIARITGMAEPLQTVTFVTIKSRIFLLLWLRRNKNVKNITTLRTNCNFQKLKLISNLFRGFEPCSLLWIT